MINGENKLDKVNVAIVGATGAVGEVMLEILAERNFPVEELTLLASERSAGTRLQFQGKSLVVQDLAHFDFSNTQIGPFAQQAPQYHFSRHLKLPDRLKH